MTCWLTLAAGYCQLDKHPGSAAEDTDHGEMGGVTQVTRSALVVLAECDTLCNSVNDS